MRLALAFVGALIGLRLATSSDVMLGLVLGAAAGWLVGEIIRLQGRVGALEKETKALRGQGAPAQRAREEPAPGEVASHANATAQGRLGRTEAGTFEPARGDEVRAASAPSPTDARAEIEPLGPNADIDSHYEPVGARVAGEPAPAQRPPPPASRQPLRENEVVRAIREYFTGGNTLVRVGIIILFFGVAFLLRYVAERTQVPVELRLTGVAIGAIVLLVLGWRLRTKRAGYALALQGGATGILYLIVFAALRLYSVLPASVAFPLMVLIVAFSGMLAVMQSSIELAVIGIIGGFLAPILASTGQGNHVVLFSYYAVLNAGILGIAWFKAWRPLNVLGFLFTFVIGTAWGVLRYKPDLFATTEPFLVFFFVLYVAIAILFASRQSPQLKGYVDGTIVFGTPIAAFGLQSALLHDRHFALAFSALVVSAGYLTLEWTLFRLRRDTYRLLVEAFMALGVAFLTLAIPLALDGRWSAATWALEGAALVWIGARQNRKLPRLFGSLLQIASGVIFWSEAHNAVEVPVLNSSFLGGVMIAAASIFAAHTLNRHRESLAQYERWFSNALFFWGVLWWAIAGTHEIDRVLPHVFTLTAELIFFAATALISAELQRRLTLPIARWPVFALLPALYWFAIAVLWAERHPFAHAGFIAWPLAFAVFYFLLRRYDFEPNSAPARAQHTASAWLLVALLGWESAWQIDHTVHGGGSWPAIGWALLPAAALYALLKFSERVAWPLAKHRETYVTGAGGGIALYLIAWMLFTNFTMRGDPLPLPYVPFLNPLDLAEAFSLLVLARFALQVYRDQHASWRANLNRPLAGVLAIVAFIWLNGVLVRTLHHWAGIPFEWEAMLSSTLVQTAVSIFWTVLALTIMLIATRRANRIVWLSGTRYAGDFSEVSRCMP